MAVSGKKSRAESGPMAGGDSKNRQGQAASARLKERPVRIGCGEITRVVPGSRIVTARLLTEGRDEVRCLYAPAILAPLMGAKDCSLPLEGSKVLLISLGNDPDSFIAVCTIPSEIKGYKDLEKLHSVSMYGDSPEQGYNFWNIKSWVEVASDKDKPVNIPAPEDRPFNMFPGEWAVGNTMGCMIALFHFIASLKATERAKIEAFVLDDLVRITSGQFQHWHPFGETSMYTDAEWSNLEFYGSHFAPEARGYNGFGDMAVDTGKTSAMEERFGANDYAATIKKRLHLLVGALGDMVQVYLHNPQSATPSPNTRDSVIKESALFKMHLDNSGALNMASSSGMGFELSDAIPVPVRTREPWDPEGTRAEFSAVRPKNHYYYDHYHWPWARNIKAIDGEAWERALSYQRFDELPKDWTTVNEQETEPPNKKYDPLGSNSYHDEYKGRKAGIRIEDDGSIRLWDSFGGEIYMRGGDIEIACPGTVYLKPGKNVVAMSGNVIMKAYSDINMSAEKGKVQVAGQFVEMYARRNMLLETSMEDGDAKITLKSISIGFLADQVFMHANNFLAKLAGAMSVAAYRLVAAAKTILMESDGTAGISLASGSATMGGRTLGLYGGSATSITKGTEVLVPMRWQSVDVDQYDAMTTQLGSTNSRLSETSWLAPYDNIDSDAFKFKYRTSREHGTESGIETFDPEKNFSLYQTRWQLLHYLGNPFVTGLSVRKWKEDPIHETYPWPGAESRGKAYVSYEDVEGGNGKTDNADRSLLSRFSRDEMRESSSHKEFSANLTSRVLDDYIVVV